MNFETLIKSVEKGNIFSYALATDEKYVITDEILDGKRTGNVIVKERGGNVSHKAAIDILLATINRQFKKVGLTSFATDAIELVSQFETAEDLLTILEGAKVNFNIFRKASDRFFKQVGVNFEVTDLQICQLLLSASQQKATLEVITKAQKVTPELLAEAQTIAKDENTRRADVAYEMSAKLRGLSVEAARLEDAQIIAKEAADIAAAAAAKVEVLTMAATGGKG